MHRASVDLPQPLSPTRPSVSPRLMSRLTPSTARISARTAAEAPRGVTEALDEVLDADEHVGVLLRGRSADPPRSRRRPRRLRLEADAVGRKPARRHMPAGICDALQRRRLVAAAFHHVATARMEGAARRRMDEARRKPRDRDQPTLRDGPARQRLKQPFRIGMMRTAVDAAPVAVLHRPPGVHDQHVVARCRRRR